MPTPHIHPGAFVYAAGSGLNVVLGKKTIRIAAMGGMESVFWDIRRVQDIHATHAIPVSKITPQSIRMPADKESLMPALELVAKTYAGNGTSADLKTVIQGISSTDPVAVAHVIHMLAGRYRGDERGINAVPKDDRSMAKRAIELLAEDLSMASGLSFSAARDHITALVMETGSQTLWPLQARGPKPAMLDEQTFIDVFGIDFEQALDLDAFPPVLEKDMAGQGGGRYRPSQTLLSYLEKGEATGLSGRLKKSLQKDSRKQEAFRDMASLIPMHGMGKAAMEFAFVHLDDRQARIFAYTHLVRADARLTLTEVAEKMGVSQQEIGNLYDQTIMQINHVAQKKKRTDIAELIDKAKAKQSPEDAHDGVAGLTGKTMKKQETEFKRDGVSETLRRTYADLVQGRGKGKGAFDLATHCLSDQQFGLLAPLYFVMAEHRKIPEVLAEERHISLDDLKRQMTDAIKAYAKSAVEAERASYITREMVSACPEIAEYRVPQKKSRKKADVSQSPEADGEPGTHGTTPGGLSEEDILDHMRHHGFDAQSLEAMGDIYGQAGALDKSLCFYGAACDLADGDTEHTDILKEKLNSVEEQIGHRYETDRHFSAIEMFLQQKMNGTPADGVSYEMDHEATPRHKFDDKSDVIDAEFQEIPRGGQESFEKPASSGSARIVPRVTYGIPPEVLKPGQRLKMLFRQAHDGSLEVTMEVELAAVKTYDSASAGNGHVNGHSFSHNGAFNADNGLNVTFEQKADGRANVSINGHDDDPSETLNGTGPDLKL